MHTSGNINLSMWKQLYILKKGKNLKIQVLFIFCAKCYDTNLLFFNFLFFAWQFIDLLLMSLFQAFNSNNKELQILFGIRIKCIVIANTW